MIAYAFWHRKKPEVERQDYENAISKFQESLREPELPGFAGSLVARLEEEAPWFNDKSPGGYEDWYLLDGSAVMDKLNEFAVGGARKKPHDDLANLATDFRGGLYQLRIGSPSSLLGSVSTWISKQRGYPYESFYDAMTEFVSAKDRSLWRRQMTLGPTPEFCLISEKRLDLPKVFNPIVIHRKIVWGSSRNLGH